MKLWQVLEQAESGYLCDGNKNEDVVWKRKDVVSDLNCVINFYGSPTTSSGLLCGSFDLNQEVQDVPNAPYLVEIESIKGTKFHLGIYKHVPHIPEEPLNETYVFEIKTLIRVEASTLDEAYGLVPNAIRLGASDMIYEYNEEETLATRGELK